MEKNSTTGEMGLEVFGSFVLKSKEAFAILGENIKNNIKRYEQSIEMTERDIFDSESAREKCEHEISRMEDKINVIKEAIENVENTYKKMVDAYSSTSKGGTKDIYSDVIASARANCEEDVERNRSEIAKLNSDIESIKNNIAEFTRVIDGLNKNLENYKTELAHYKSASTYLDETRDRVINDLENIDADKDTSSSKKGYTSMTKKSYSEPPKYSFEIPKKEETSIFSSLKDKTYKEEKEKKEEVPEPPLKEEEKKETNKIDDSLQRIYDLTGYKPEKKKEDSKEIFADSKLFGDEFNIFDNKLENNASNLKIEENDTYNNNNSMSEWESILNGNENVLDLQNGETVNIPVITEAKEETKPISMDNVEEANELLKPYGTNYDRLKSLISDTISYKDGKEVPFSLTTDDVIKAVNSIDSLDLKSIKTIGAEVTILRKIKKIKEGLI